MSPLSSKNRMSSWVAEYSDLGDPHTLTPFCFLYLLKLGLGLPGLSTACYPNALPETVLSSTGVIVLTLIHCSTSGLDPSYLFSWIRPVFQKKEEENTNTLYYLLLDQSLWNLKYLQERHDSDEWNSDLLIKLLLDQEFVS